jgi:DtxR family transcriptional regulator, manganese transport regulator
LIENLQFVRNAARSSRLQLRSTSALGNDPSTEQPGFEEKAMSDKASRPASDPPNLPTELAQARRFGKTRSAQSTALIEDYVELIDDLLAGTGEARPTDIARRLGVSHATAIKMIARLKREGVATARPYRGVFLTESGHALAARVRSRHRLVVDVLVALGVPAEAAEADAEGIEHHVSDVTLKAFARFLRRASPATGEARSLEAR